MTTDAVGIPGTRSDQLIDDYLRDLRVSAWMRHLSKSQTALLESEVRTEIATALAAAGSRDEATVYRVLDHLGPAGDFVARLDAEPRSGPQRAIDRLLKPFVRLRAFLGEHGWGLADIGALMLLIVGPFFVWWIGPIFGIILLRAAADRWSDRVMHRATVAVVALLTLQALIALALFAIVLMVGGPFAEQIQRVFSNFAIGGGGRPPLVPGFGGVEPLSPLQILMASPPYIAGLGSGLYLLLSPRHRH